MIMTVGRLQEILEHFGTDFRLWPEEERDEARALICRSDEARSRYLEETLADLAGPGMGWGLR
jgi:hypothetical protein